MGLLPGMCINEKTHDLARIDVQATIGTLEVWKIVSRDIAHPFHVHGDSGLQTLMFLDVVLAPPRSTATMLHDSRGGAR